MSELRRMARDAAQSIVGAIHDERLRRLAQPCVMARYFEIMAERGRPIMRPWRRWRARVWRARCLASGMARDCGVL